MDQTSENEAIAIGRFGRPHGTRGELRLWAYNPESELFEQRLRGFVEGEEGRQDVLIKSLRWADRFAIVKLKGVFRREMAEPFKNLELFVLREDLPEPDEDEFYLVDAIGWPVFVEHAGSLVEIGKAAAFMSAGASDVMRVALTVDEDDEGESLLVPMIDDVILEMNPDEARVVLARLAAWAIEGTEEKLGLLTEADDTSDDSHAAREEE